MPVVRLCMRSRPWCCLALAVALVAIAPELAVAQSIELANMPPDRTMPGFAVIDSSTMSIEHIAPLHSTTLTLFSTLRSDDLVPRDLGLEILPWLTTHPEPGSTVKDVYDKQYRSGVLGSIGQYAAWSLAVSQHGAPSSLRSTVKRPRCQSAQLSASRRITNTQRYLLQVTECPRLFCIWH